MQGSGGVEHVGGGEAEVEVSGDVRGSLLDDRLRDGSDEGDNVVVRLLLDLLNALYGKVGLFGQFLDLFRRDLPEAGAGAADGELDLQPSAELGFLGPEGAHLGEGVAFDHRLAL